MTSYEITTMKLGDVRGHFNVIRPSVAGVDCYSHASALGIKSEGNIFIVHADQISPKT